MAFVCSVSPVGNGTLSVAMNTSPTGTQSWTWQNTTTGGSVHVVNGATGSGSDSGPQLGVSNTVTFKAYSGLNATGTVLGTTTRSDTAAITAPTVTVQINDSRTGCTWNAASELNTNYSFLNVDLLISVNGGSSVLHGTYSSQSGSIPDTSRTVGYNKTVVWTCRARYHSTAYGDYTVDGTGSGATGDPPVTPPSAPAAVTGLTATDNTTNIVLNWTGSAGGATGYEIARSGTVIGTTAAVTYTDNTPGAARPITYTVTPYNTNSAGTTYGPGTAVTVPAPGGAVKQQQQMML